MTKDKSIDNELIDNLLKNYKKPEDLIGENGLLKQLTKQLLERAMAAEMTEHVGYDKHDAAGNNSGNSRNGKSAKTIKGTFGELALETPRDRNGTFEPQIIEKHQTRFTGFDKNILSLYSRGLSTREIQQHLEEIYGVEVTAGLISSVTDEVLDEVKTWQNRQLDAVYPIMYLDAIQFKVRDNGHVRNKAIYLAIGVTIEGYKEVLGLWIAQTEGAKFWLQVVTELKNRGVTDIFIACVDGLKGFPEAIESVFPQTEVQLCIVHLVRHSLNYVGWKQRKEVARELKLIYTAATDTEAEQRLAKLSGTRRPVFIGADKSLHFLPFATLISPASGKYLIEDFFIGMVPSASVLIRSSEYAKEKTGTRDETVLSIGNPNFDRNAFPGLPALPGAGREARSVGAVYRQRTVLVGPEASPVRVASELKNADVIHIATHAVAHARSPMLTKLLLAGGRQDGVKGHHADNGFLQASQIYQLKLPRARLVVLSACQTGIERAYRGEGAIGLARPFLVAGVPIVVASLWPVDSEATAELMIRFHEHRTRGHKTTIEALRQAQLDMIYNPPPGSQGTFGWAAFVAIGGYAEF